jgi:ABC-type nickel/cobalt efflux system permease component RcnA
VLAIALTFAHTVAVVVLGVVLLGTTGFVSEAIYPWITLVSGAVVVALGARALARYVRLRRGLSHDHGHGHSHDHHGHDHAHGIGGTKPLGFGSAIVAAMSGGIAPCPAAIVVLLVALRLHQLGYGLVLIVVFSMGLASVLSALGLAVVRGASWISGRSGFERALPYAPLASALVISSIGAGMIGQGFHDQGVAAPPILIAGLALCAAAGYALSQGGHEHASEVLPT